MVSASRTRVRLSNCFRFVEVPLSVIVPEPREAASHTLILALQAVTAFLANQSEFVQKQVARMLRGFLEARVKL